jgi:hypothetical protein
MTPLFPGGGDVRSRARSLSVIKGLLVPVLLAACSTILQAAPVLEGIELVPPNKESFSTPTQIPLKPAEVVSVDLELGDSLDNVILRLRPKAGVKGEFIVEQSFETSLTVMEEGPHLDLLDWKHYRAPWVPLKKLGPTEFRIAPISEEDARKFPEVTPKEIRAIVTKEGGATLGKYVSKVKGPNDYPCGVGISKISFRIKLKEGAEEKVIKTLEFLVPMGC